MKAPKGHHTCYKCEKIIPNYENLCDECAKRSLSSNNRTTFKNWRGIMELIDVNVLRAEVLDDNTFDNDIVNYYLDTIDNQPTIDTMPVMHGEWIEKKPETKLQYVHPLNYKCSSCGFLAQYNGWRYCPDCGAKMDTSPIQPSN